MATHNEQPVPIFCAYAPEDERFYQELAVHLHIFSSRMLCTLSHAGDIPAGSEREHALISLIEQARLVLVLLSPDYFRSVFSDNGVLQELLARKAKQECLIPLLLRACAWQDSLFSIFLPLPRDGSPISSKAQRDAAWLAIVEEIRPRITQLAAGVSDKALAKMTRGHAGPWCVPYRRNPFFTGRDELLAMLHERLHTDTLSGQTPVLAISGLGGIGKTQVALEYAYRYRGDYSAVLWVTAETPEMLLADFIRFVEPLGLSAHLEQGSGDLVSFVKDWLHQHRDWLLIFDNADTIEVVRDYLPAQFRSQGQILLTTRATTAGELAKMIHVEDMSASEGELFLLRRAGLLATEAPLEQAHEQRRRDAAHIVAELDGLPLGIDQAGAYIAETSCSLEHYLRVFHQCRARLLAQRGKLPPGHPEPVATTWKLSFQRIERTAAADLLRLCAFFSPDSIPEAIFLTGASVLGPRLARFATDPLALDMTLATLRSYSLIKRNADSGALSLHRLVQAVLRDALTPAKQRTWAERALRALGKAIPEPEISHWHAWQPYLPQVVACVQWIDEYQLLFEEAGWLLNQAGTMLRHYARYAEAEKMYERALRIDEQVSGPDHPHTATTLNNLATLLGIQRRYEHAVQLYERALRIRERVLGPEHPETASTINGLALLYSNWHRYDASQHFYERALRIRERVLGPEHPETAMTLDNLAMLYRQQGNYEQARTLFERALQIREHALGPEHPMTASTINNLAVLYRLQGNYEQASPLFERALQIRERTLGPEHPATATVISNLAYLSRLRGQYEQSLALYQRALSLREHAFGSDHPNATITWLNIGELYQEMGATEQAETAIQRALLTHEQSLGSEHPRVVSILEAYIKLLHHAGKDEEAKRLEARVHAACKR